MTRCALSQTVAEAYQVQARDRACTQRQLD